MNVMIYSRFEQVKIIAIFLFVALSSIVKGDDFLVSVNELPDMLSKAKPGDNYLVKNGTYSDINLTLVSNTEFPVSIRAQTPGQVIFEGASSILIKGSRNLTLSGFLFNEVKKRNILLLSNSHEVFITENYFLKCGESPFGVILGIKDGSTNNHINQNTFDGNRAMGVVVIASPKNPENKNNTNNRIYSNFFYNIPSVKSIYPDGDGNGLEAVQLGQGVESTHEWKHYTQVYNNLFEKITGDGSEIVSNKTSNNVICNNTFLDNASGLTLRIGNNVTVNNNYFNNTSKGIRVFGHGHVIQRNFIRGSDYGIQLPSSNLARGEARTSTAYFQQDDCDILDNVILEPKIDAFVIGAGSRKLSPRSVKIRRNKVYMGADRAASKVIRGETNRNSVRLSRNEVFVRSKTADRGNTTVRPSREVRYESFEENTNLNPELTIGFSPFVSKDVKAGASWKRPR